MRIASPEFTNICHFGTDIDNKEVLIAHNRTVEEIREIIGADSLEYLSLDNLSKISEGTNMNGFSHRNIHIITIDGGLISGCR